MCIRDSLYSLAMKKMMMFETVVTPLVDIQDLTTSEQASFLKELEEVAALYPGQEDVPEVQAAVHDKILGQRPFEGSKRSHKSGSHGNPGVLEVITVNTPTMFTKDDDSRHCSSFRSTDNKKHKVKLRAKFGEKVLWDGRRTTFCPLEDLIVGHLLQVNGSYMVSKDFLHQYYEQGEAYLQSDHFKKSYYTSYAQAKYDRQYFYGILR